MFGRANSYSVIDSAPDTNRSNSVSTVRLHVHEQPNSPAHIDDKNIPNNHDPNQRNIVRHDDHKRDNIDESFNTETITIRFQSPLTPLHKQTVDTIRLSPIQSDNDGEMKLNSSMSVVDLNESMSPTEPLPVNRRNNTQYQSLPSQSKYHSSLRSVNSQINAEDSPILSSTAALQSNQNSYPTQSPEREIEMYHFTEKPVDNSVYDKSRADFRHVGQNSILSSIASTHAFNTTNSTHSQYPYDSHRHSMSATHNSNQAKMIEIQSDVHSNRNSIDRPINRRSNNHSINNTTKIVPDSTVRFHVPSHDMRLLSSTQPIHSNSNFQQQRNDHESESARTHYSMKIMNTDHTFPAEPNVYNHPIVGRHSMSDKENIHPDPDSATIRQRRLTKLQQYQANIASRNSSNKYATIDIGTLIENQQLQQRRLQHNRNHSLNQDFQQSPATHDIQVATRPRHHSAGHKVFDPSPMSFNTQPYPVQSNSKLQQSASLHNPSYQVRRQPASAINTDAATSTDSAVTGSRSHNDTMMNMFSRAQHHQRRQSQSSTKTRSSYSYIPAINQSPPKRSRPSSINTRAASLYRVTDANSPATGNTQLSHFEQLPRDLMQSQPESTAFMLSTPMTVDGRNNSFDTTVNRNRSMVTTATQVSPRLVAIQQQFDASRAKYPITITWNDINLNVPLSQPSLISRLNRARAAALTAFTNPTSNNKTVAAAKNGHLPLSTPMSIADMQRQPSFAVTPSIGTGATILKNVSGYCKPGQTLAILGSSGAGKTSLLNVLSGRTRMSVSGNILFNGQPRSKLVKKYSAFVQQTDVFFKSLTVKEHLMFQAQLRIPESESLSQREIEFRVDSVLDEMGLYKVRNTRIGDVGLQGISGGERRRLSFATEVLTNPSILFCDEPTSGLDSFMASEICEKLKHLASAGRTVICTIHQPSSEVYALFDTVCFMAHSRVAYFGSSEGALQYFSSLNFKCPSYSNPSDYFIRQLSIVPAQKEQSMKQCKLLLDQYESSSAHKEVQHEINKLNHKASHNQNNTTNIHEVDESIPHSSMLPSLASVSTTTNIAINNKESKYVHSRLTQFQILLRRSFVVIIRDPTLTKAKALQSIVLSLIVGLIYLRLPNNQKSIQNTNGAVYFILINQSFGSLFGILNSFASEIPIFKREHDANMYSTFTYYIAKTIAELPNQIIFPALFTTIAYFMIGLHNDSGVVWIQMLLLVVLCANCATSLGLAIATMVRTIQLALAISPLILLPFLLFGGFFVNTASIPVYFIWLEYLSFFKYAFAALSIVIWSDYSIGCESDEICTKTTGEQVLSDLSVDKDDMLSNIIALIAIALGFRTISYLFLLKRANTKQ